MQSFGSFEIIELYDDVVLALQVEPGGATGTGTPGLHPPQPDSVLQYTEVGRAFLIHFQKLFLRKAFIRIKIARKFKFYV